MHNSKLHIVQQERRNQFTGFPEMAFYRPPSPVNVRAAKNGLMVIFILAVMSAPLWIEFFREVSR